MARMDLHRTILPDSITTRFSDVFGQDKAVARMQEQRALLDYPDEIEARGGYMPGGVLLEGPPGTGKTLMAEAFAGETGKPFVSVGPESFTNMFVGVPVLKVKMLFRHLRKLSIKHGGVVCFMDEIDALGSRGGGVVNEILDKVDRMLARAVTSNEITISGGGGSGALQMLLTEMSGIAKPKGMYNKLRVMLGFKPVPAPKYRILWIGATNMAQTLDAALLRPGRFDRRIKVSYPDREGREVTFQSYLDKIDNDLTETEVATLARENPQATGASIKDAVNEGLLKSAREGREVVTWHDMRSAILWKMMGEEQGEMDTETDRWGVALHEAAHAVASIHLKPEAPIQFASVIKRDKGTAGFVRAVDDKDIFTRKKRLQADVKVSLASVWAEKYFFDDNITTGPSSDLKTATRIVTAMVTRMAMGSTIMVWEDPDKIPSRMEEEVQDTLHVYYDEIAEFLEPRRDQIEMVAKLLQKHGTVDGIEIHELVERMEA